MSELSLQVLVVTMNQEKGNHALLEKMNIQSDVLVGNQCSRFEKEQIGYNGHTVGWYSWDERGVGLNRNNLLMRATADIVLFADDDVTYVDAYEDLIVEEFIKHPEADVIAFNIPSTCQDTKQRDYVAPRWRKLNLLNCFRHGTFRIAVRREAVLKKNIFFTLLFGGGAKYSAGEDSLFIADCIRKKLKVYESDTVIGSVSHEESTWFKGYTDKYFRDKGAFYACFSKCIPYLWCLQFAVRRRALYREYMPFSKACRLMKEGIVEFKSREK